MPLSDRTDDIDPQRRHFERMRRSRELGPPDDAFGQHEQSWAWSQRVLKLRGEPWTAFGRLWRTTDER